MEASNTIKDGNFESEENCINEDQKLIQLKFIEPRRGEREVNIATEERNRAK